MSSEMLPQDVFTRPRLSTGGVVSIKHLLTNNEDSAAVTCSMKAIYKELMKSSLFGEFDELEEFDDERQEIEHANYLLFVMYDYADDKRILIR